VLAGVLPVYNIPARCCALTEHCELRGEVSQELSCLVIWSILMLLLCVTAMRIGDERQAHHHGQESIAA
jgi:hypothetical protein